MSLPGPDYDIKAEFGKQSGANLFHSFQQFNIHQGESATFTGPDSVQNIISRVTGGSASWIDGKLGSTIPNADLYFLNPAGVMFGKNATLDLSGSFHVSTADYLRLGENDRFYAMPQADERDRRGTPAACPIRIKLRYNMLILLSASEQQPKRRTLIFGGSEIIKILNLMRMRRAPPDSLFLNDSSFLCFVIIIA